MADSYSKWVMTNAFASNSQSALNAGNKIEWVALKTSDDTHALNDLSGFNDTTLATAKIKQTSSINSVVLNGNTVTITGLFNSAGNTADYYIKTIFLVAKYNGTEFLAGATVANTSGSAFRMPAASTTEITEFTARPQISVTNSSTISTTVDPVAAATNERVNNVETSLNEKIIEINTDKQKLWNKLSDYVTKAAAETITGVKTFLQPIVGSITGNAGTATKLQTERKLNGVLFDGTSDVTVPTNNNNETIGGVKKFLQPINGSLSTRNTTFTKFADVAKDMSTYSGQWFNGNNAITDSPASQTWLAINVISGADKTSGVIEVTSYSNSSGYNWIGTVNLGSIKWVQVADDSKVLHNSGNQTINGSLTINNGNLTVDRLKGTWTVESIPNGINSISDLVKNTTNKYGGAYINTMYMSSGNKLDDNPFNDLYSLIKITSRGARVYVEIIDSNSNNAITNFTSGVLGSWNYSAATNSANIFTEKNKFQKSIDTDIDGNAVTANALKLIENPETDLNNYKVTGKYLVWNKTVTNFISSSDLIYGMLFVSNYYSNIQQVMINNLGNSVNIRWFTSSKWTNWQKINNDNDVVHLAGNETINGDKKFLKPIIGNISGNATTANTLVLNDIADGTDLNSLRDAGNYSCGTNRVGNAPINNWFSLVVVQNGSFNGVQTLTDTNNGEVYTRTWNNSGSWFSPWEKLSSDSKVVHTNGDETINGKKTFNGVATFNNGIVNKPISMNGVKMDVSELVSGSYNVWLGDISGCPANFGVVEVFENVSNTMYRFTQTNLPEPHIWVQTRNSFGFSGWKQQM